MIRLIAVVEKLNLLVSSNGALLRSEIVGAMKLRSCLSGMPELKLGLNDKLLFEASGRCKFVDLICGCR
jgi:AP-1 complex subunit mu